MVGNSLGLLLVRSSSMLAFSVSSPLPMPISRTGKPNVLFAHSRDVCMQCWILHASLVLFGEKLYSLLVIYLIAASHARYPQARLRTRCCTGCSLTSLIYGSLGRVASLASLQNCRRSLVHGPVKLSSWGILLASKAGGAAIPSPAPSSTPGMLSSTRLSVAVPFLIVMMKMMCLQLV